MTIVVADTGPLNYLIQCDAIEVLPILYEQFLIPSFVFKEISHPGAPQAVRSWVECLPHWVVIRTPSKVDQLIPLGRGEVEAISLALEVKADEILLDDRRARNTAIQLGLTVSGTLGVLETAAKRELLKLPEVIKKLEQTNFRIDRGLLEEALRRDAIRSRAQTRQRDRDRGIER